MKKEHKQIRDSAEESIMTPVGWEFATDKFKELRKVPKMEVSTQFKEYRTIISEKSNKFKVVCMECGKKFKSSTSYPTCPKCKSTDIELDEVIDEKGDLMKGKHYAGSRHKKIERDKYNKKRRGYGLTDEIEEGTVLQITDVDKWTTEIYKGLKTGWKSVAKSTLGGDENVAIMIKVTVEPEKDWPNKILHNASFGMVRIATDGTMEMFASGHKIKNMRKTKVKSAKDVVSKINKWADSISEEIIGEGNSAYDKEIAAFLAKGGRVKKLKVSKKEVQKAVKSFKKKYKVTQAEIEKDIEDEIEAQSEEWTLQEEFSEKDYDALKKGDIITIDFKSSMSSGKATFKVTAKNVVGKAKVGKVTLKDVKRPGSVKFYLYKRGNKVSLAQGDMAASVVKYNVEEVNEAKILKPGTEVKVAHPAKGKGMVTGKIVRYDKGGGGYSPFYIVDIGERQSEKVPAHKIKEEVDMISEVLKTKDKSVIDSFYDQKPKEGRLMSTDGKTLDKMGMGGQEIAKWVNGKIKITAVSDVKSTESILKYMKASIPKNNFEEVETEERNYRKEYDNYHSSKEQIARRSSRNQARRIMGDKTEEGKDVGHKDNNPLNNDPKNLRNEDPSKNRREPRLRKKCAEMVSFAEFTTESARNDIHNGSISAGIELEKYAKKSGGIDKDDMMATAAILKKGKLPSVKQIPDDTDPRDKVYSIIAKHLHKQYLKKYKGHSPALDSKLKEGWDPVENAAKKEAFDLWFEARYKYKIDHKTYTSAVEEALLVADKAGYEIDEDDYFNQIATGPRKPGEGKTNTFKIGLQKGGKEQKKRLQIQIYGKGKHGYELNCYIQ